MPRVVVRFSSNPSGETGGFVRQAETSRNIIELARLYQWGRNIGGRDGREIEAAAKKRALQLGFRVSDLEVDQRGILRRNLTDRAHRYRANAEPPEGPKRCFMCGTRAIDASGDSRLMVGHLDGHESHNEPENLVWTCRSCNTLHANALKRARMGRRTAQFNPTKSGGAYNVGEWANAVGAIRAKRYPENRGREGALGAASTMSVSDAVAMIRATPQHKRQQFAAALGKHKAGRRGASDIPF